MELPPYIVVDGGPHGVMNELVKSVNAAMKKGYEPCGNMVSYTNNEHGNNFIKNFFQPMTLKISRANSRKVNASTNVGTNRKNARQTVKNRVRTQGPKTNL